MSSKKLSGAQQRKRKREQEADAKISGLFMQRFLKLGQTEVDDKEESDIDNVGQEAVNDPPSCYQLDDSLMTSAIQLQPSNSSTQTAEATSDSKQRMLLDSHDFGYIDFDSITGLSNVADNLRMELISRGPEVFQNKDYYFAVSAGRSMTLTWFKRSLPNGEEDLFCFIPLLKSQCTVSVVYYSLQQAVTQDRHLSYLLDFVIGDTQRD
ncbi:zinc finger MYM-type protein 1 [Biomphalaria glabrata]|nr:zinc finger MYM-type protein 1 [Biomphalaria glabrata]